jgi:hypothetical protein
MSRTPNLRIMVEKLSFPNGLVKISASCSAEVTNSVDRIILYFVPNEVTIHFYMSGSHGKLD